MRIRIIAIGQKMPAWVEQGYAEYAKRLRGDVQLELVALPMQKRTKGASGEALSKAEGKALLAAIKPREAVVALDVKGKAITTGQLAERILQWQQEGQSVALLVGGPDGLSQEVLSRASAKLSLSALTLPHPLVRVLLAEQLYRAWSINQGHPYHR